MANITFDPEEYVDYIPKGFRNKQDYLKEGDECYDPDYEPFVVQIKPVTYGKIGRYSKSLSVIKGRKNGESELETNQMMQKRQFTENIGKISGFYCGSLDRPVTTAAELYEIGDMSLILELIKAMETTSVLQEGQKKT